MKQRRQAHFRPDILGVIHSDDTHCSSCIVSLLLYFLFWQWLSWRQLKKINSTGTEKKKRKDIFICLFGIHHMYINIFQNVSKYLHITNMWVTKSIWDENRYCIKFLLSHRYIHLGSTRHVFCCCWCCWRKIYMLNYYFMNPYLERYVCLFYFY